LIKQFVCLAPLAIAALLTACGAGNQTRAPDLHKLPLVDGARVVSQTRVCDRGANPFCGIELVVVAPRYRSSTDIVSGEHTQLRRHGWTGVNADIGQERAADSPSHALRVTYAAATGELNGIELGWIKRSQTTALALSRTLFDRAPAMFVLLEVGSS
jgi:hypothetical protein